MDLIPLLIFGFIAFKFFSNVSKKNSNSGGSSIQSPRQMMQRLTAEIEKANKLQDETSNANSYSREKIPTQRGRESLQSRGASSPWGENGAANPGARVATNYLKTKTQAQRKASHKSPVQRGRRGENMDQNRHRTDGWGQRGDSGMLSMKAVVILMVIGGGILFMLSNMPAS